MNEAELLAVVRDRAPAYLGLPPGSSRVELVASATRPKCRTYRLAVRAGGERHDVIVKAMAAQPDVGGPRPRLGLDPAEWSRKHEIEYDALARTAAHFALAGDDRIAAVRPYDLIRPARAVVMEFVPYPALRQSLRRATVLDLRTPRSVATAFHDAGRWLAVFHGIAVPTAPERRETASAVADAVGEYTRFLAERTGDAEHLRQVREEWRRLAERHLPERLRTCVGHGDFAPRNIFNRAPDGVTGFDMVTEWRAPVLEDVAHFLLSLSVHGPRARLLSPARIADLRSAFLRGYFGTESVPSGELACVGVLVLLDKWAAAVARGGGPGDDGARSRAFRRDLATVLGGGLAGREQPVRT